MVELTARQHFHRLALMRMTVLVVSLGGELTLRDVLRQYLDVHGVVFHAVDVREALQLGDSTLQGHLATLEPGRDVLAGAGPLGASSGRLAADAGTTPADPLLILLRPIGAMQ